MSLFGSLFTGVSALSAQSQSMGMISNNVANVSTTGYKRNTAAFGALVTTSANSTLYNPGSVQATRIQNIDQQGALQQTASATDLGISGSGFFVVQKSNEGIQETFYTRAGDFKENAQGYLINSNGYYLMGWPLDENGQVPASQADISSLQSVNVSFVGGFTKATTQASLAVNLKGNEIQSAFPATGAADFTRGLRVYDSLGAAQDISFEFTKTIAPTANATSTTSGAELTDVLTAQYSGLAVGDQFSISVGGNAATTVTVTNGMTVQGLLDAVNNISGVEARLNSDGRLLIQATNLSQDLVIDNVTGGAADELGFGNYATASTNNATALLATDDVISAFPGLANNDSFDVSVGGGAASTVTITTGMTVQDLMDDLNAIVGVNAYIANGQLKISTDNTETALAITDNVGGAATDMGIAGSPPIQNVATAPAVPTIFPGGTNSAASLVNPANSQGWWNITIKDSNGNPLSSGYLNFNGDGTLNAARDADGEVKISLDNIDWGNGSDPQDIDILIDRFTQYSGNYNVIFSDQNGAELGLRTGVEIDEEGIVYARFSNGQASALYKLPLATFTNVNGLEELSGVAYRETSRSGSYNLREANQGGAGEFQSGALENSNVDLADEFSKMIVTQRAYSAATKIITTVDDMTEELLRLR